MCIAGVNKQAGPVLRVGQDPTNFQLLLPKEVVLEANLVNLFHLADDRHLSVIDQSLDGFLDFR